VYSGLVKGLALRDCLGLAYRHVWKEVQLHVRVLNPPNHLMASSQPKQPTRSSQSKVNHNQTTRFVNITSTPEEGPPSVPRLPRRGSTRTPTHHIHSSAPSADGSTLKRRLLFQRSLAHLAASGYSISPLLTRLWPGRACFHHQPFACLALLL
jgi:hypothetical protein